MDTLAESLKLDWTASWRRWLDAAIHHEILRLRVRYDLSLDEFRGLYISNEQVDRLVNERQIEADLPDLREIQETLFGARDEALANDFRFPMPLSLEEKFVLFCALAPELDLKYLTLYAYLNNDVTKKHLTADLAGRLSERELTPHSLLFQEGLLEVPESRQPSWLLQPITLSDKALHYFLGAGPPKMRLNGLAVKETTHRDWTDLVLPPSTLKRLKELAASIRHREKVFKDWGFERPSGGSSSLRILFSGASGTGKTLSATVIAHELGLDLYRIDLSSVVSKYIGETEKNLEQVFKAAEGSEAILFFDEADALFGKRSEVKDAHDRFANIEVAYLLQRMEQYQGVMILATNIAHNIDEAFNRRIHFQVQFSLPDENCRRKLWRLLIPGKAPTREIDFTFLAKQFPISGGEIRNAALDAAFLAAHEAQPIGMSQLIRAMARQRIKQGRLPSPSEFKSYFSLLNNELGGPNDETGASTN